MTYSRKKIFDEKENVFNRYGHRGSILTLLYCLGGLVGGNTEVVPADEETAMKYQMCGSQLGVDWSWVMLIDMYMADQEHTDITSQNMVYTALNCLKVTIEVYEEEEDEDGETHWEYDHTDYAYGADAIMEYFGLPKECRDVQQVVQTMQRKNSSQFHISTAPYDNLRMFWIHITVALMKKQKQRCLH